jgi:uncharacterized membrane protein (GlpM family)
MTFWEGLIRFVLGGSLVLLIGLIAKNGKSAAAGIMALFPVITAVSFTFLARSVDIKIVKATVLTGIVSLPATAVFLLSFYFCIGRMHIALAVLVSLLCWLAAALVVYYIRH